VTNFSKESECVISESLLRKRRHTKIIGATVQGHAACVHFLKCQEEDSDLISDLSEKML